MEGSPAASGAEAASPALGESMLSALELVLLGPRLEQIRAKLQIALLIVLRLQKSLTVFKNENEGIPGCLRARSWSPGIESQDRVPHRAPGMEPASLSSCVSAILSLSMSIINKQTNK